LTSSSIESSSHNNHRHQPPQEENDNKKEEEATSTTTTRVTKNIYFETTTATKTTTPSKQSTTINRNNSTTTATNHKPIESSNINYLDNSCLDRCSRFEREDREANSKNKLEQRGNSIEIKKTKTKIMDFDCNPTDYISSFKNGQLVEEESLIGGGDINFDNHG